MFKLDKQELVKYMDKYQSRKANSILIDLKADNYIYTRPHESATWKQRMSFSELCEGMNEFMSSIYSEYEVKNIFMKKIIKKNPDMDDFNAYLQVDMKLLGNVVSPWNMGEATVKSEIVWNVLTKMTPYINNLEGSIYEVLL